MWRGGGGRMVGALAGAQERKRRPGEAEQGGVCESGREVEAERERRRSRGGGIRISVTLPVLARAEGEDG